MQRYRTKNPYHPARDAESPLLKSTSHIVARRILKEYEQAFYGER
jgi:hypothetical protein